MRLNFERQDAIKVIIKTNYAAFGLNQEIMNFYFTVRSFRKLFIDSIHDCW